MRQLATDLVVPSCQQFHLYKVVAVGALQIAVVEPCQFGILAALTDYVGFILLLVADHPLLEAARVLLRPVAAQCPVGFVNLPLAKHRRQPLQGLRSLGEDADSADRSVEPVGDAQENLARLGIPGCDESLVGLCQGFVAALVTLSYLAHLLIDDQKVVVFE